MFLTGALLVCLENYVLLQSAEEQYQDTNSGRICTMKAVVYL